MKIKIKKESKKKILSHLPKPGPKVRDIKIDKSKTLNFQEPLNSQVIEIKEEKEEERKTPKRLILSIGSAVLAIVATFIYFFGINQPKDTLIKFAPKETIFYLHLNLNKLSKNQNLNSLLNKFGDQKSLEEEFNKFLDKNFFLKYNLNFENDIKPLLGKEAALGVIEDNNKISPYLLLKINEEKKVFETTDKIKTKEIQESNIVGAKIKAFLFDHPKQNFYFSLTKNTVIITQNEKIVEKIIHTYQTKNHLQIENGPNDLFQFYLNNENLSPAIFSFLPKNFKKINPFLFFLFQNEITNFYFGLNEKADGLVINYHYNHKSAPSQKSFLDSKMLTFLPSETIFAFLGYNLKNSYLTIENDLEKNEKTFPDDKKNIAAQYLKDLEKEFMTKYNLDVKNDLLPFFEKETLFLVLPKTKNTSYNFALITKIKNSSDQEKQLRNIFINFFAAQNLKEKPFRLADGSEAIELVPDKKAFEIKEEETEGIKIFNLVKKDKNENLISYALQNDILFVGENSEIIKQILSSNKKLVQEKTFQAAFQKIPRHNTESLLYLNVSGYLNYLNKPSSSINFWQPIKCFVLATLPKNNKVFGKGFLLIK